MPRIDIFPDFALSKPDAHRLGYLAKQRDARLLDRLAGDLQLSREALVHSRIRYDSSSVHVYYGGTEKPDGRGHGHIAMQRGTVTFHRPPGAPIGRPEHFMTDRAYIEYKRRRGFRCGWLRLQHGFFREHVRGELQYNPITYARGWGKWSGDTRIIDGHVDDVTFYDRGTKDRILRDVYHRIIAERPGQLLAA